MFRSLTEIQEFRLMIHITTGHLWFYLRHPERSVPPKSMGYLERGYVILLILAIVSGAWSYFTGSPNDEGKIMHEKCWKTALDCNHWSGEGVGFRSRFCWVRCQCKGYATGACKTNRDCLRTSQEAPWKCECFEKQRFYKRMDCDGPALSWRLY